MADQGLYILLINVHGLIRGNALELGRDPDTGGQILYVLELARALGKNPQVAQVDLLTRLVADPSVSGDYARAEEVLAPNVRILRIPFGPRRYIRKELLWDHLDHLVDAYLVHARSLPRLPDLIHSHYGDAGYVAMRLSSLLGIPFIHSAHSLGRGKKDRMLKSGGKEARLEQQFHFTKRISIEEEVLAMTSRVITSTQQEIEEQYASYVHFQAKRTSVIPPGTDVSRFFPPRRGDVFLDVKDKVDRFLVNPKKPMILCIGRPAPRKNLMGVLQAFGEDPELRRMANLVLIGGNRDDINALDEVSQETWKKLLLAYDHYDLYGHAAIPKQHSPEDIPELYRLAVSRRGICVNPSYSETFGLTLIEAAATGLPLVATNEGGPKDIIANCRNGILMDAMSTSAIAEAMKEALRDPARWNQWSRNGIRGVKNHYTWEAHVQRYLKVVRRILHTSQKQSRRDRSVFQIQEKPPFLSANGALILDLDRTLVGDRDSLPPLLEKIRELRSHFAFGIATGRRLESTLWVIRDWGIDLPDVIISSVGTEIHYGPGWRPDDGWHQLIRWQWRRAEILEALASMPGVRLQAQRKLSPCKVSYYVSGNHFPGIEEVQLRLSRLGLKARLLLSQSSFLDVIPPRASKGQAVRYLSMKWGIPLERFLVAGDSGNDMDMLTGDTLGIVVGNHSPELAHLRGREGIYFATQSFAAGVLEGIEAHLGG